MDEILSQCGFDGFDGFNSTPSRERSFRYVCGCQQTLQSLQTRTTTRAAVTTARSRNSRSPSFPVAITFQGHARTIHRGAKCEPGPHVSKREWSNRSHRDSGSAVPLRGRVLGNWRR